MATREQWVTQLLEFMQSTEKPCILVECPDNFGEERGRPQSSGLRERVVFANAQWYQLCEYEESEVVGKSFSEIRGLQGELTSDASKLKMGSLLITERSSMEGLRMVNYTGRSHLPIELELDVKIFKQHRRNAFFLCSVMGHRSLAPPKHCLEPALEPLLEPEPEQSPETGLQQAWEASLKEMMLSTESPCILVVCDENFQTQASQVPTGPLHERIVCANREWYDLYEYEESEIVGKSFSQIRGFQGQDTSEESKLRLASLFLTKENCVDDIHVVNYNSSGLPLQLILRASVFRRQGRNAAWLCTTTGHKLLDGTTTTTIGATLLGRRQVGEEASACSLSDDEELPQGGWSRQSTAATQADHDEEELPGLGAAGLRQRHKV